MPTKLVFKTSPCHAYSVILSAQIDFSPRNFISICFADDILRPYLSSLAFAKSKEDYYSRPKNLNLQGQTFFSAISKEMEWQKTEADIRGPAAFKRQRPANGSAPGRESRHDSGLEGFELLSAYNSLRFRNQLY